MPEIQGLEKLLSFVARKKFGVFPKYGTSQFAWSHYGDDDAYLELSGYGDSVFGLNIFADVILLSGIYRTDNVTGITRHYREPFYITRNPRYESQQAWRGVFADAVAAWQALTSEQKSQYNKNAVGKGLSGYNLFLKEYLRSH